MGKKYIWETSDWPDFSWDSNALLQKLGEARRAQGRILAKAEFIGLEAHANVIIEDAYATSAIEGEQLDRNTIRSSVARRHGLPIAGLPAQKRNVECLVEMLLDATGKFKNPLTIKRIHGWQASLFPTGYSGIRKIQTGKWRTGAQAMQVVSAPIGQKKVHFEAPPAESVPEEMKRFLKWWKNPPAELDGLLRAGIAHFWIVTIHPYEDGNGRISRAITDMALSQDENSPRRLYSLSAQIGKERDMYYEILEKCQKQTCDLTVWLNWFLEVYTGAIVASETIIQNALMIAKFWQSYSSTELNKRQTKVVQKLLEAEPEGFDGGLTNRKYVSMTKTSRETAKRELADLEKKGILRHNPGRGRSTSYKLAKNFIKLN